jgi:membrane fusion protein, heavy metal efflux system
MNRVLALEAAICMSLGLTTSCQKSITTQGNAAATGPIPAKVVNAFNVADIQVDHPERFPLATATEHMAAPELNVTGSVNPDISRQVPVPSLATGRVTEIDTRLGDTVKQGQLLFKVRSTDVSGAYSDYRKAIRDEQLTKAQLNRAQILYEHGAIPKSALEVAQDAEDDALVDVDTTTERIHLMGLDPNHSSGIVAVYAPITGVITDQQITNQSGVQALTAPNPFTISDMSSVWIVCDVYENDLASIHMNDSADIRLNAYPSRVFKGKVSNIRAILDPNIRTAKVRIEVANPGEIMRLGMFATATFKGQKQEIRTQAPAAAILHLHDRDWVYMPAGSNRFRRQEVVAGSTLPNNMQEVISGLKPGDQVIADALIFENAVEQ